VEADSLCVHYDYSSSVAFVGPLVLVVSVLLLRHSYVKGYSVFAEKGSQSLLAILKVQPWSNSV
jgi:hypothetical protein